MDNVDFAGAKVLILEGKIKSLEELYKQVSLKDLAQAMGYHPVFFTNKKSKAYAKFDFETIEKYAAVLEIDFDDILPLFIESYKNSKTES